MAGLKKFASYLNYTKEMKIHYPKVELHQIVFTNWKDNDKVVGKKPHQLEFFSDADWASCKTTRHSTSIGIAFLNGCCIYSHSRAQVSIALSSMLLAATGMLTERHVPEADLATRALRPNCTSIQPPHKPFSQDLVLEGPSTWPLDFCGHSKR